jgi:hypothetical protein
MLFRRLRKEISLPVFIALYMNWRRENIYLASVRLPNGPVLLQVVVVFRKRWIRFFPRVELVIKSCPFRVISISLIAVNSSSWVPRATFVYVSFMIEKCLRKCWKSLKLLSKFGSEYLRRIMSLDWITYTENSHLIRAAAPSILRESL